MLNLSGIETGKSVYWQDVCPHCGHLFIYKSSSSVFKLLWDKSAFDLDYKTHQLGCLNEKIERFLR